MLERYLVRVNKIKPSLREIFILDRSNKILFSTNKEREGDYEILANITYVENVEEGANFAPMFYVSPITRKPAITLAKPLENRQGWKNISLTSPPITLISLPILKHLPKKVGIGKTGWRSNYELIIIWSIATSQNQILSTKLPLIANLAWKGCY